MKKLLTISALVVAFAGSTAFGQGYVQFVSGKSQVFDGFTTAGASATSTSVNVALFWANSSTASPFAIASTPTTGNSLTSEPYTAAQAWSALTGSSFTEAVNAATSQLVVAPSAANGFINYNGGASFGITGLNQNATVFLMMVSFSSQYSSISAASAAGSAIGWSTVFSYASKDNLGTPSSMAALSPNFGTFVPVATPEPSTMALAALGGASLLLFRRRK